MAGRPVPPAGERLASRRSQFTVVRAVRGGLVTERLLDPPVPQQKHPGHLEAVADEFADALGRIRRSEFKMGLSGLGCFGGKKPHSLFAVPTASPDLIELQAEIERICQRLRLPADPRKFTPHVTVARLRNVQPEMAARYLSSRGNFHVPPFTVSRFVLMSSRESVGGGPYIVEDSYPLTPRVSASSFSKREPAEARIIR